jgi:hypothetical protein
MLTMSPNMSRLSVLSRTRNISKHAADVKRVDDLATRALVGHEAELAQRARLMGED